MAGSFDYFILLAAMRTGSNLLEDNLNALDGVNCLGEAFNPHFIGRVKSEELLGITLPERDADPERLLSAIRTAPGGLYGFRYFQGHDPRVLAPAMDDPRCAKIILTRNPVDSYLSLKIVRETKQWQLKNIKRRLEAEVTFDASEFKEYLDQQQAFLTKLHAHLQRSGQTAFYVDYDDLTQVDMLNGLANWLGTTGRLSQLTDRLKPQNPASAVSKVTNPDQMRRALSDLDLLSLHRPPNFEPYRGPAVDGYVIAPKASLLFMPVRCGIEPAIQHWLADLQGTGLDGLITQPARKQIRDWMQSSPGHRKFTVITHPLVRAHSAFCTHILNRGDSCYTEIRTTLRNRFKLPIPGQVRDKNYSLTQHYEAFSAFLTFLRHNLSGQTPIRVDAAWCSQSEALRGMSEFALPDLILREDELTEALSDLARKLGFSRPPAYGSARVDAPFSLKQIHDAKLDALAAEAYPRDYVQFGFTDWTPVRGAG